ncbi:MAG: GspE/PulE family protein, partial [Cyanobacteria bacterium J06648_11]
LKILHGLPTLDIELDPVDIDLVSQFLEELIPIDICSRYRLLPVRQEGNVVSIAMVEPENLRALDDLNRRMQSQGLTLKRLVITPTDLQNLTAKCLDIQAEALSQKAVAAQEVVVTGRIDDLDLEGLEDGPDEDAASGVSLEQQARSAEDAPVIKLANQILVKALQEGTSDIHVEPQETHLRIRFRKDGVLQQAFDDLPLKIIPALTARFKIISDLDIAERRMPQDGRIRRVFKGRKVDFRVSTLPSRYGEKIVLRILDNSATQLGLDKLITDEGTLAGVKEMVARPFGLILVTGPTGSGKTTTLYSALSERNDPDINISTAEDPIEYSLPGITQVQVIREKGMDFAMILRAFLRQDPDVILVGETRDLETAKTAIEASLTGHLVLTTLHTNDAPGAIARLTEMGIEPFMISSSLLGVLAQRLMR